MSLKGRPSVSPTPQFRGRVGRAELSHTVSLLYGGHHRQPPTEGHDPTDDGFVLQTEAYPRTGESRYNNRYPPDDGGSCQCRPSLKKPALPRAPSEIDPTSSATLWLRSWNLCAFSLWNTAQLVRPFI